jgi:hypothetical protein
VVDPKRRIIAKNGGPRRKRGTRGCWPPKKEKSFPPNGSGFISFFTLQLQIEILQLPMLVVVFFLARACRHCYLMRLTKVSSSIRSSATSWRVQFFFTRSREGWRVLFLIYSSPRRLARFVSNLY